MRKKVNVNFDAILESLELGSEEITQYLNMETGGIAFISEMADSFDEDGNPLEDDDLERFEDEKYVELPIVDSREGYREMEDFIQTVKNPRLREKLEYALDQRRPFRRFKDVLKYNPSEEQRHFKIVEDNNRRRALEWLEEHNLEVLDMPE